MSVVDLFSGAGGFSEGFSQAGFKIAAAFDNWQLALDSHKANHPHTIHINKNILDVKARELEKFNADIILGSPPCQQFSVANKNPDVKKGLELTNVFLELIADLNPRFWIMENVLGVRKHIEGKIRNLGGYSQILNAANYGTPQIRKRVFCGNYPSPPHSHGKNATYTLVGKLDKWVSVEKALIDVEIPSDENLTITEKALDRAIAILKKEKLDYYVPIITGEKPCHTITAHVGKDFTTGGLIDTCFYDRHGSNFYSFGRPSQSLTTKITNVYILKENIRRLSSTEAKILMGFPKDYTILGNTISTKFRQIGNAVCPPVAKAIAKRIKEVI